MKKVGQKKKKQRKPLPERKKNEKHNPQGKKCQAGEKNHLKKIQGR